MARRRRRRPTESHGIPTGQKKSGTVDNTHPAVSRDGREHRQEEHPCISIKTSRNINFNWFNLILQGQGGASPVRHSGLGWSQVALTSLIRGSVIYITVGHGMSKLAACGTSLWSSATFVVGSAVIISKYSSVARFK